MVTRSRSGPASGPGLGVIPGSSPVISAGDLQTSVRPANLDRPLHRTSADRKYTDPHLEEMVRAAADTAREEARAQGYLAGWAQGRQAASAENLVAKAAQATENARIRSEVVTQVRELLEALRQAVQEVRENSLPDWDEVADVLGDGALQIASQALGREMRSVDGAVTLAVKAALRHVNDPGDAVVHLHPDDAAMLSGNDVDGVQIVPDPRLSPGDVTLLTPAQRLRHDLPAALAAAAEVLRS